MSTTTLQDGLRALVEQYGADTVAAAVALLVSPVKECKRCGHTWTPRTQGTPRQCPGCHSQGWQTPRKTSQRYGCRVCGAIWSNRTPQGSPDACPTCHTSNEPTGPLYPAQEVPA